MKKFINGRWVIGVDPFTPKQLLKIYWLLVLWLMFTIYLIVASIYWDIYLIAGEEFIVICSFLIVIILTTTWFRREERKNYIYKDIYKAITKEEYPVNMDQEYPIIDKKK